MTQILVIIDSEIKVDVSLMESILNTEVKMNAISQDGISLFECGRMPPPGMEWDWVGLVGTCTAENEYPIDVEIPVDEDPVGNLITALSAVLEGQDTDEALGEQ
jgi:hypothetical protein